MDESTSNHTHPPSRQQAAVGGSRASSKATHAPSAKLWKQVNVHRTLRPLHGPPRARSLHSTSLPYCGYVGGPDGPACTVSGCRELPSRLAGSWGPSDSAMRFSSPGVLPSSGASTSQQWRQLMPMTCERNLCPTGEGRDGTGPSSRYEGRVFQPLLHCAQEKRWVTTNLGSAHLDAQDAHAEPHLRMHPSPSSVCSIDLKTRTSMCRSFRATGHSCGLRSKDEHISTGPALRAVPIAPCLHESSGGSPCSLERSGRTHSQLPRRLAHTGSVSGSVMRTQGLVLSHLSQLGLRVNWEKSKLLPMQRISFLGMEFGFGQSDSAPHAGTRSVGVELLEYIQEQDAAPLKQFQRLLGHMAAAAAVTPLGLLHMRPLQHWLHGRVPRWAWQSGTLRVQVTPACRQTFTPWSDLSFLRAGVPLEQVSRHAVVYTDASAKGWGATFNGHAVSGVWTGPQLHWHINCLELLAVHLALNRLKRRLRGEHVLVRTDNTATVAYINRQGGLRSRRMSQLARHLLLWSRKHLRSLRAIHIPGLLNRTADELSRAALPGEWRLHPQTVQLIWRRFGLAQVDLFASLETSHCQLFYSLTDGTLGTDALAHSWPRGLRKYAFPPVSLLAQTLCKVREEEEQILLVAPYWPTRTWFPELMLLVTAPPWQIPLRKDLLTQRRGTLWHPRPDLWKLHVWSLDGTRRF